MPTRDRARKTKQGATAFFIKLASQTQCLSTMRTSIPKNTSDKWIERKY
jgi:hypothetical protein